MTLRRRMVLQIGAMIVGLLLISGGALRGLDGLRSEFGFATAGYQELRELYEVGSHVATARMLLRADTTPDRDRLARELDAAQVKLQLLGEHPRDPAAVVGRSNEVRRLEYALRQSLARAASQVRAPNDEAFHATDARQDESLNLALSELAALAIETRKAISRHEDAALAKWRATIRLVGALAAVVVLGAVLLGAWQYRGVIRPLQRLGAGARRMAGGNLDERVEARGDTEFAALADDFNHMATELQALYRDLEQKVANKSKQLVRSERLASVGYLAAGVAHEINNPLSIITGYAERALRQLEHPGDSAPPAADVEPLLKGLRIICEEAYRCKAITERLLAMARPGDEQRTAVNLSAACREVAALLAELPAHRDRKLALAVDDTLFVHAAPGQIKQVLLNLVINALQSTSAGGNVTISLRRDGSAARLTVSDDGRGMSPETLERVFEPFFTEKRGSQQAGTGLGLSIAHAIITSHGGRIWAESEGAGRGSRFVVELATLEEKRPGDKATR